MGIVHNFPGPSRVKTAVNDTAAMNRLELTSICALMAYAAYHRNVSEETVTKTVLQYFGVEDVSQLPSKVYDEVIRFLVDVQIDMFIN